MYIYVSVETGWQPYKSGCAFGHRNRGGKKKVVYVHACVFVACTGRIVAHTLHSIATLPPCKGASRRAHA